MNNEQAEELMRGLDFVRIRSVMAFLDWVWCMKDGRRVPTVEELKDHARDMLLRFGNRPEGGVTMCGGFVVMQSDNEVSIVFELDSSSVRIDE